NMPIVAGSLQDFEGEESDNGIILSSAVAEFLNAKIGDDITILAEITKLYSGDKFEKVRPAIQNTGTYTLKAIFHEQNFFAYACYLHRRDLNALMSYPEESANEIAIYFNDGQNRKGNTVNLYNFLVKSGYENTKLCLTREEYNGSWKGADFVLYSLDTVLGNITDLIFVFNICTYFILAVFLAIMIVGILNTYKVLIYERIREIGTMRAMGMQKNHVAHLFISEALLLALFSCLLGFILALVTLQIITGLNFSHINLINFFTINGHLRYWILPRQVMVNLILVASAVIAAAIQPITNACKVTPSEALSTD
ncbi:MAG: FtsX-like permease family protein, partial [Spirochaetaceae bacterium]|nr:FtsX-like permease family protein [Spirochaetaceae bacterium]